MAGDPPSCCNANVPMSASAQLSEVLPFFARKFQGRSVRLGGSSGEASKASIRASLASNFAKSCLEVDNFARQHSTMLIERGFNAVINQGEQKLVKLPGACPTPSIPSYDVL